MMWMSLPVPGKFSVQDVKLFKLEKQNFRSEIRPEKPFLNYRLCILSKKLSFFIDVSATHNYVQIN